MAVVMQIAGPLHRWRGAGHSFRPGGSGATCLSVLNTVKLKFVIRALAVGPGAMLLDADPVCMSN